MHLLREDATDKGVLLAGSVDGELFREPEPGSVLTQNARAKGVEGAQGHAPGVRPDDGSHPLAHLAGRAVGERHRQDSARVHARTAN